MKKMQYNMLLSIVIPCYKSEKSLPELIVQIKGVLKDTSFEIILINDASPDDTWLIIEKLQQEHKEIRGINLMKNFGQHPAVICGLNYTSGEYIITMDDDLQNPPEEIPRMLEVLKQDQKLDAVIGIPKEPKKSFIKKMGSNLLNNLISSILNKPKDLKMSSFRALRASLVSEIKTNQTTNPAFGSLLLNYTRNIKNIEVKHNERKHGTSGYSLRKSIKLFLNNVLNYSTLPLRIVSNIGIASSIFGFVLAIFYVVKYLVGNIAVPGWTSLIVIVLIFFGLVLFALGIIGEYLVRIISEVNHSRQYVIRNTIGFNNE